MQVRKFWMLFSGTLITSMWKFLLETDSAKSSCNDSWSEFDSDFKMSRGQKQKIGFPKQQ